MKLLVVIFLKEKNEKNIKCQNIIISRYPILSTVYTELDDDVSIDDIIGTKNIICANILIENTIICVYNTELTHNIKDLINTETRLTEIDVIVGLINENRKELATNESFANYNNYDIHILAGTFNIPEVIQEGSEYDAFIQKLHCIDIYRHLNEPIDRFPGYTNTHNERISYILFLLSKDVYRKDTKLNKKLMSLKSNKQLFEFLFKRYHVYFLDYCIREDVNFRNISMHYPIEFAFMLQI